MRTFEDAFTPLKIGPLELRNRFIKAATNEGKAKGGVVSKGLARFHEQVAEGGVGMTTVAYCAVSSDGRTFPDQAIMDDTSIPDFRALTEAVHRHGAAASAQITHGGSFNLLGKEMLVADRPLSSSGGFNKVGIMSGHYFKKAMDRADMEEITEQFVASARRAREAGFDAVELHMGHGYLLSQFISKLYNKRRDEYGGTIASRLAFPSEVLGHVLDAVGKDLAVLVKFSMTDGPKGNDIGDGIEIAKRLQSDGAHMCVLSNGLNVDSVETLFGSTIPNGGFNEAPTPLISIAMRLQSLISPRHIRFHENYLRDLALQIRREVNMPLAYLGGVTSREGVIQVMQDEFEAITLGRALLYDPSFVNALREETVTRSGCTACNHCVAVMYSPEGTHCVMTHDKPDAALNIRPASSP